MKFVQQFMFASIVGSMIAPVYSADSLPILGYILNDQAVFAHTYVTTGANKKVYGNILANQDVTIGAGGEVFGSTQSRDLTTGDSAEIYMSALTSGDSTLGANATVSGNLQSGGDVTFGANARVNDTVQYGGAITYGAGASAGTETRNTTPPFIVDEHQGVIDWQSAVKDMGDGVALATGDIATDVTFTQGVYNVDGLLTTTADITITLDAQDKNGDFVFNVSNYLSFGAGTVIRVINRPAGTFDNVNVIWNAHGAGGYISVGAHAEIIGTLFATTYVSTGAYSAVIGADNSCGGIFSATSYVTIGANATVGGIDCSYAITPPGATGGKQLN